MFTILGKQIDLTTVKEYERMVFDIISPITLPF